MKLPDVFSLKNGNLCIENVEVNKLTEEYDTPVYIYSESRIIENYRRLNQNLKKEYDKVRIHFSAKSNTNISILSILREEGASVDVVSAGEIYLALKAGFEPEEILFTGTNIKKDDLDYIIDSRVMINVDSLSFLDRLLKRTTPELISFRVNPNIGAGAHDHLITAGEDAKFGIMEKDIIKAYRKAQEAGVKRFGLHMHIGSGILDPNPHKKAIEKLMDIAGEIKEELDIEFEFIDIGGGIGVPYRPEENEIPLKTFIESIIDIFKSKLSEYSLGEPYFCIEPGRYIVSDAGIILTRVNTIKETKNKTMAGVDAGLHTLIRPAMYDSYHHIIHAGKMDESVCKTYDIMGPLCESSDFLGRKRKLPKIGEGELLAILNAGAYGFTMSSNYNSMLRPPEVLLSNGKDWLIREAESMKELDKNQMNKKR